MKPTKDRPLSVQPDEQSEFDKDIWDGRKLGADIRPSDGLTINFRTIFPLWLRQATKQYIRYSFATLSWATCKKRKDALNYFSSFLTEYHPGCLASNIERSLIINFFDYLVTRKLAEKTRLNIIVDLDTFFTLCSRNGWVDLGDKVLIYREDHPHLKKPLPRYIPQEVLEQINQYIETLPESVMRMVLVIQETGMRISELCRLKFDCLKQDSAGDWWLSYYQFKMKKDHTITISKEIVAIIQEQQNYIKNNLNSSFEYLFCGRKQMKHFIPQTKPMNPSAFTDYLKRLCKTNNICDASGKVWDLTSHQFRHSVGTRMINNGVPQHIIQRYLGHESPNMTATYAHIFDSTLKKEIAKYHGKTINILGQVVSSENPELETSDLQWFKRNVQAQALPNGSCARPIIKGQCPHANACFTCGDFRTTLEFLDLHKEQLEQTEKMIEKAKANNWQRQVEMNEQVKINLQNIISSLESDHDKDR
ncbi:tyrosine-type recombinase/integrase [Iningainema tapete]|uniref:Tyrosine-type recombinase/integrase n=1 Tax=Iningainema tapete BLCC-T55 TaxID=2748662 RepID=A0A8J6XPT4_9CYAN|nr:site-specific integrase [Iningainema tapete]MBD2777071.1 tyrosine-type recombinase/integrase [Iningainema tapete BLCC-T55]